MFSFSPPRTDFAARVTLSRKRGAERHPIGVVRIVVVVIAAAIDIIEVVSIVSRAEPPARRTRRTDLHKYAEHNPYRLTVNPYTVLDLS